MTLTVGENHHGTIRGYKDPASTLGGFGAIQSTKYKTSKIFLVEARELNGSHKIVEVLITPAISANKIHLKINGAVVTLDKYANNDEIFLKVSAIAHDAIWNNLGKVIDISITDDAGLPVVVPVIPGSITPEFIDGTKMRNGSLSTKQYKEDVTEGNTIQSPDIEVEYRTSVFFDEQGLDPYEVANAK